MSARSGFEDVLEIHSRLFNHKPFVQAETKQFAKQFEEERGDREVENIFSCLEKVSELRDLGLPLLRENLSNTVSTSLIANLQVSESMSSRILEQEDSKEIEKTLVASREAREKDWTVFLQETQIRSRKVEQSLKEQEENIRKKYQDLESSKN